FCWVRCWERLGGTSFTSLLIFSQSSTFSKTNPNTSTAIIRYFIPSESIVLSLKFWAGKNGVPSSGRTGIFVRKNIRKAYFMCPTGLYTQLGYGIVKAVPYIKTRRKVKPHQHDDGIPIALVIHRLIRQTPVPGTKYQW